MKIKITQDFLEHVKAKALRYNPGTRSPVQHKLHIECEVVEYYNIKRGVWDAPPITGDPNEDWKVDAVDNGKRIDCKFLSIPKKKEWLRLSSKKYSNIIRQKDAVDAYRYYMWEDRPNRLLEAGDVVSIEYVGDLSYAAVANQIKKSGFIKPGEDEYWITPVYQKLGIFK